MNNKTPEPKGKFRTRLLNAKECEVVKRELIYRFGSVASWARENDLPYISVTQVLNGLTKHQKTLVALAKEGLYKFEKPSEEVEHV
ncbi:hypothetical protein [Leptospira licerasiae]|uniref:hypothetical protein n=1 Tax=Leptospira licerasiae TaxID=447106 RepID=UPI00108434A8|nr:hypothetical protein [Leptospira licerasiae]TGM88511.1 hypothetical protein EHR05_13615 [Leptospira licerasiae]